MYFYAGQNCTTVSNNNSGYTGSATFCATATGITKTAGSCVSTSCPSQLLYWGNNCKSTNSFERPDGYSSTFGDGYSSSATETGSAVFTCDMGTWVLGENSCNKTCSRNANITWGSGNCSDTAVGRNEHDYSISLTNDNSGYTGSATVTCDDGTWDISGATCTADAPTFDCASELVSFCSGRYQRNTGDGNIGDVVNRNGFSAIGTDGCGVNRQREAFAAFTCTASGWSKTQDTCFCAG